MRVGLQFEIIRLASVGRRHLRELATRYLKGEHPSNKEGDCLDDITCLETGRSGPGLSAPPKCGADSRGFQ